MVACMCPRRMVLTQQDVASSKTRITEPRTEAVASSSLSSERQRQEIALSCARSMISGRFPI